MVERANGFHEELTQSMEDISKASDETSKIIKTIDEIAFQTNLLASTPQWKLHGPARPAQFCRGGHEVRNLAMRDAEAAKSTSVPHRGNGEEGQGGLGARGAHQRASPRSPGALQGGTSSPRSPRPRASRPGIDQINKAVAEMDKVTQQTAANAEESASASEEMNAQAEQMKDVAAGSWRSWVAISRPGLPRPFPRPRRSRTEESALLQGVSGRRVMPVQRMFDPRPSSAGRQGLQKLLELHKLSQRSQKTRLPAGFLFSIFIFSRNPRPDTLI